MRLRCIGSWYKDVLHKHLSSTQSFEVTAPLWNSNLSQDVAHSSWTTFPHKKKRFETTARQSESSRVTVECVFCGCAKTSRSSLDGGHSLIQVRTVRDLERNKTSPATDSLLVPALCKRRNPDHCTSSRKRLPALCMRPVPTRELIQTTARQVESGPFDIECAHNSSQIRCASHAAACVFTITRNISPHCPCNTTECHQEDHRKVSVEPSQIHA